MRYLPIAAFVGLGLLWGSDWMLAASLPPEPRLRSLALQYALSALLLLPLAIRHGLSHRRPRSVVNTIITGIGILCLPQLLIFYAREMLAPTISLVALAIVPVLLAMTGRLSITIAVCGLAGVLFLSESGLTISLHQSPWLLLPLSAAGVLAWALAAAEMQLQTLSIVEVLFAQCASAALLLFLASALLEREPLTWSAAAGVGFVINAMLITGGGYLLFYWLLAKYGAGRISTLQWLQPLVATSGAAALMHIRPTWPEYVGAGLIAIATALAFSNTEDAGGVLFEITQSPGTRNR
jgi:O-acetylserine/cysteine efflux transporter